jgi:hypothetical protein
MRWLTMQVSFALYGNFARHSADAFVFLYLLEMMNFYLSGYVHFHVVGVKFCFLLFDLNPLTSPPIPKILVTTWVWEMKGKWGNVGIGEMLGFTKSPPIPKLLGGGNTLEINKALARNQW